MSYNNSDIKKSLVSIIILNYNGEKIIIDCLNSIFKTENSNFEVILIDNNSNDESHKICKKKFPEIQLIENKKNFFELHFKVGLP